MKKIYIVLLCLFCITSAYSTCVLYPVSLNNRVTNSSLIIEGTVISKQSFWNAANNYIYTSNLVSVTQMIKGAVVSNFVEIITDGGEIAFTKQVVEPALQLEIGQKGVFMVNSFNQPAHFGYPVFQTYADEQGFIVFNSDGTASEPFKKYSSANGELKTDLQNELEISIPFFNAPNVPINLMAPPPPAVTAISPLIITAGTASQLTITGTAFGALQGTNTVLFKNADNGGATNITPHTSQYVSWSNTQIVVEVPSITGLSGQAGTGQVTVSIGGVANVSAQTLTIQYGHINVSFASTLTPQIFNTRHHALNGLGGITWKMFTGFDAMAAPKADFLTTLAQWRCATFINWTVGATTAVNSIGLDGTNVVRFDIAAELPVGVLGRCSSYFGGCFAGPTMNWHITELDICFDDAPPIAGGWQYGPGPVLLTQYDFASVSLHELGHGHQLSHVINPLDVMHYALSNGQNNSVLNVDDIAGGVAVMTRNTSGAVCGNTVMVALNAGNCALAPTASFNIVSPVCTGATVSLNDLSTNTPTAWVWTMTGGVPPASASQNTSTSYSAPGIYTITLVASNGSGTSAPFSQTIQVVATPTVAASNATICSGTSTVLTASGAVTYTWNPGALVGATQTLSPGGTTPYTITGSNGTCTAIKTITINVNPSPTVSASNATICSGSSTVLTASGATSYTWNPGALTGATQTLSPGSTTPYTITGSNGTCTSITNITINVNTTPTVSASNATICSGTSTVITASGATSYTWNPGGLTGATQTLSPPTTTVYTIIGANGSCTSSISRTVTVNATPTLAVSNATICAGSSTVLTASGAASFTWNPGGLTGATQTLSPPTTTVYTIIGSSGTCTSSINATVNVNATPTLAASNATICSGNSTIITASGAASFTWNPGGLTGATQTLSPPTTTVYTIIGANGSCTSSISRTVTVNATPTLAASNATICSGSSTVITASGAASFTWNPGALTGATQTLSPPTTTIYTIIGASGTCTSSINVTVNVNATPTVAASNATICSGSSTVITASGAVTYTWNPGALTGATQTLSPPTTTVYTIIGANGSCTSSISNTVTVNSTPTVAASNATICSGNSTVITASGAASFTWNPGALTGATQTLSPPTTTVYTIIGANGTCTSSISRTVTVNATPTVSASNATICAGNSTVITAIGAVSYTWNPGALTGATQTLNPITTTTYVITGSNGICSTTSAITVNVNTTPTLSVSNATICSGSSTVLTVSGAASYTWNPGALSGATQTLSPIVTTTYNIIGANGTCTSNISNTITVNTTPTITVSSGSVCSGNSTTLNAIGGTSYTWNPGALTGATQTLSPGSTTVYTVTGTNGSCTATSNGTLNVTATPTLSVNNATTCSGVTTTLTANGATSYTWNPGALAGSSQTFNPIVTTTYTVTGDNGGGCISSSNATIFIASTLSVGLSASQNTICEGGTTTITASGANNYTFNPGGIFTNPAAFSPTITTTYTVDGLSAGCAGNSVITITVVVCTGIVNVTNEEELLLYPNPTQGWFNIRSTRSFSGKITVFNNIGQLIMTKDVNEKESIQLNLTDYAKGVYLIKLSSPKTHERFIKLIRD